MAMAGAFTSLGADLSSMSINPAGLGMYRHGDISITPMMSFARSKGNAPEYGRNSRDRFSMANIGVVINAYEGSRSLISLNVASATTASPISTTTMGSCGRTRARPSATPMPVS